MMHAHTHSWQMYPGKIGTVPIPVLGIPPSLRSLCCSTRLCYHVLLGMFAGSRSNAQLFSANASRLCLDLHYYFACGVCGSETTDPVDIQQSNKETVVGDGVLKRRHVFCFWWRCQVFRFTIKPARRAPH